MAGDLALVERQPLVVPVGGANVRSSMPTVYSGVLLIASSADGHC
jgi:hypothetical protein